MVILFFAFGILFLSLGQAGFGVRSGLAAASLKFSVSPAPTPKLEYFFPYPGILPDSPLYNLKMVRDKLWLWLTTDSLSRTNLLLLYADKRLGAGKALIEGNKTALGVTTLTKAEKYLEKAIVEAKRMKGKRTDTGQVSEKLGKAVLAHREILTTLKEKLNSEGQIAVEDLIEFSEILRQEADKLR